MAKQKVKALGVWLSVEPEVTRTLNYDEKLEKVRNILSCWIYRRLTLIGKIAVLKSLVVSQLVYVLSPLNLNARAIKVTRYTNSSIPSSGMEKEIKLSEISSLMIIKTGVLE